MNGKLRAVVTCGIIVGLIAAAAWVGHLRREESAAKSVPVEVKEPTVKRLPVAGAPGTFVVVSGSESYIEYPGGKQRLILPMVAPQLGEDKLLEAASKIVAPALRPGEGQLVVCDGGVIEVPKDAVITLIAATKVVVQRPDGSSATHYLDGKVEVRDRSSVKPKP